MLIPYITMPYPPMFTLRFKASAIRVVGPTRASFASDARIPQSGAKGSTTSRFPDSTRALGVDEVTTDLVPRETVESHPGHLDVRSQARKAGDLRRLPPEPDALPGLGTIESACGRDQGPYSANLGDMRSGPPATGMNSGRSPASIALTRRSRLISRRHNRGRRDRFHGRPISQARLWRGPAGPPPDDRPGLSPPQPHVRGGMVSGRDGG